MIAAEMGYANIVRFLLSKGADLLECRISDGYSPLLLAAYNGHVDVVELLLSHGADLYEGRGEDGATVLEIALENRHLSVVKLLLTKGADTNNLTHSREACKVLKYNNEFKKCLQLWPAIMGILVLQTFGDLRADTLLDLCHFASHSHSE
jgi:ankyrin repeat protein